MPANDRDRKVLEEAQWFCDNKSTWPKSCNAHKPTLEELQSTSFSDYIRFVVLKQAERNRNVVDDEEEEEEEEGEDVSESKGGDGAEQAKEGSTTEGDKEDNAEVQAGQASTDTPSTEEKDECSVITNGANDATVDSICSADAGAAAVNVITPVRFDMNTRFKHKRIPPLPKAPKPTRKRKPAVHKVTTPIEYSQGMSKVTLPKGFWDESGICQDRTGRGPEWAPGTRLGEMLLPSPMKQCIRGIGGIYEYTFLDQKPITAAEYRTKADEYFKQQVGTGELSVEELERKFWRRLGPTMPPSMYGADMEGTMFGENECCGWNLSKLQSCLQLLMSDMPNNQTDGIPGVTTPYLYFGMWASVFCAHAEDMNLLSINYLHAGAPKIWYAVAPGEDARRLEQLCEGHYHISRSQCAEYLRHKRSLVSPQILKKSGIPFTSTVQYPGDAIITFPSGYHFGFNAGFNLAEATNFAVPEWIPFGKQANICLCRPDSVRIDMSKFEHLLERYERDQTRQPVRISWKEWALQQVKKRRSVEVKREKEIQKEMTPVDPTLLSKQQARNEIWVEVVQPYSSTMKSKKNGRSKTKATKRPMEVVAGEVWHLAKPVGRKQLRPPARVLCIIPATVVSNKTTKGGKKNSRKKQDEDDEQCFAGTVIEYADDHVRVRLDGLTKKDDVWMSLQSPKLFIDGGIWNESEADKSLPALHYWREEDSKRRCI